MEATPTKKKDNTALYIVYAAAAYFGIQFLLKPKRASAATITTYPGTDMPAPPPGAAYVPEQPAAATVPAATPVTWKAEGFPLRKGMKGAKVKAMQQRLGITADGAFGDNTESALQQQYGFSTVTQVQYQTIVGGAATKAAMPAATGSGTWVAESFPLRKGMKGASVKVLQQKLGVSADGAFGAGTEAAALKKFGVTTVSQTLFRSITQPVVTTVTNLLETIFPTPGKDTSTILKSGSKGTDVYRLQKWLGFKDKKVAKKGEPIADSVFGKQTLNALQKKTGQTFISVAHLSTLTKQMAGMGYAGEVLVTKRAATILDSNLLPHRSVPENTILGTRLMELSDPQERKAYTQFQTIDGLRRWVDKDAV